MTYPDFFARVAALVNVRGLHADLGQALAEAGNERLVAALEASSAAFLNDIVIAWLAQQAALKRLGEVARNQVPANVARLEERTPNTADCPDGRHSHQWVKRPPELTEGGKFGIQYDVTAAGVVELSEEALSQLLRIGGFVPRVEHERPADVTLGGGQ